MTLLLSFIAGIIVGLLLAVIFLLTLGRFHAPIYRTTDRILTKSTPKGALIRPKSDEQAAIENIISSNENKGGTPLADIL